MHIGVPELTNRFAVHLVYRRCILLISGYATTEIHHSGGVHEITRYVMMCIKLLSEHSALLTIVLNVTHGTGDVASTTEAPERIMADLMSRLESTLEKQSYYHVTAMRWLFLVNNMHFIIQQPETLDVLEDDSWVPRDSIEFYIYMYLDVSWTPVQFCLQYRIKMIPACFKPPATRRFNTLFEKTYRAQRSWKVEDPLLRKHMRQAVIGKLIPAYRSFLEKQENKPAKLIEHTPEELEETLSELFEG
ncbi:exocyst complex component EXO70A1-like [Setaria viridis]